jgi:hypothetical protein
MIQPRSGFYRATAVCSFISAVTTLCLIFLPRWYPAAANLDERIALLDYPVYTVRLWIYLCHPFFTFAAALGIAVARWRDRFSFILPGILGFAVWGYTEALQQVLALVANHYAWRMAARTAADASVRAMARTQIFGFEAIWDALYVLLVVGFILGNTFYAAAMWRGSRLSRTLAFLFLAAATLSVFNLLNAFNIANQADPVMKWVYPLLQPAARTLIGVYLWQAALLSSEPEN